MAFFDRLMDGDEPADVARGFATLAFVTFLGSAALWAFSSGYELWQKNQGQEGYNPPFLGALMAFSLLLTLLLRERYRRIRLEQRLAQIKAT